MTGRGVGIQSTFTVSAGPPVPSPPGNTPVAAFDITIVEEKVARFSSSALIA